MAPTNSSEPKTPAPLHEKRFRSFSLRAIFILTALAAIGTVMYRRQVQVNATVNELIANGARVEYYPANSSIKRLAKRLTGGFFDEAYSVDFSSHEIKPEYFSKIYLLPNLRTLNLHRASVDVEAFRHIARCPQLTRLSLWGCRTVDDECIEVLSKAPALEVLDIHWTNVGADGIRTAAAIPSLQHLRSSAVATDEEFECDSKTIRAVGRLPKATIVGEAVFCKLEDSDLQYVCKLDYSSEKLAVRFRKCRFTLQGMREVDRLRLEKRIEDLEFVDGPLTPKGIGVFNTKLENMRFGFQRTGLTLTDLIKQFGSSCDGLNLNSPNCSMWHSDGHLTIFAETSDQSVSPDLLKDFTSLRRVDCDTDTKLEFLESLQTSANPIQLSYTLSSDADGNRFWDLIKRCVNLQRLTIWDPPTGPVRFTDNHALTHLELRQRFEAKQFHANTSFFKEVAKLKHLEELHVQNRNALGDRIHPISQPKLRKLHLENLTDEAMEHVLALNLDNLVMRDTPNLSDETVSKMLALPKRYKIIWNGYPIDSNSPRPSEFPKTPPKASETKSRS